MRMFQRLGLIIGMLGTVFWCARAVIIDTELIVPEQICDAYKEAVCDLAFKYGACEPCDWEEHEANICQVYEAQSFALPKNMIEWIEQMLSLTRSIYDLVIEQGQEDELTTDKAMSFTEFCRMLASAMLVQKNYELFVNELGADARQKAEVTDFKTRCHEALKSTYCRTGYEKFSAPIESCYFAINQLPLPSNPVLYTPYDCLKCFSVKLMLEVLTKAYFHWNITEQRDRAGSGAEDFRPPSDQRFDEDCEELEEQDDVHQIGMRRGKLVCCYKVCKTLKMVAQERQFEEALWKDINDRMGHFNGVGFVYSPIVLAGLAAASEETANLLASCVLQNFEKMHGHFIYLIFSSPLARIKSEALKAFALHFKEEIDKGPIDGWAHQRAEAFAWEDLLKKETYD